MNLTLYVTGRLEQSMMDEWSKLPAEGRLVFRDWARMRIMYHLENAYGVK